MQLDVFLIQRYSENGFFNSNRCFLEHFVHVEIKKIWITFKNGISKNICIASPDLATFEKVSRGEGSEFTIFVSYER